MNVTDNVSIFLITNFLLCSYLFNCAEILQVTKVSLVIDWGIFRMVKLSLVLVCIFSAFSSVATAADLAGSEWGVNKSPERFVQFGPNGKVSGLAGCNRFFGVYESSGDKLSFGTLATTRRLCSMKKMKAEKSFLKALNITSKIENSNGTLKLTDNSGRVLVKLLHRDRD